MSTESRDFQRRQHRGLRSVDSRDYDSTPNLLRRLVDDVGTLFAQELALFKAETSRSVAELKTGATSVALGGAVLFLGGIFLLLAAVYGLSNVMDPWLAALIVGGVVTVIGIVMLATGRRKLEPTAMAPRRTAAALRKDTQMIKGVSHHEHD
jgi:hypothetical protein